MSSLFTREAGKVWGEILHEAHNFLHLEQTKGVSAIAGLPGMADPIATVVANLPKAANTLSILQAAFAVLGKCVVVAADTKKVAADGFVNIALDKQEIEDIIDLVKAFGPIIDLLGHNTPTPVPAVN